MFLLKSTNAPGGCIGLLICLFLVGGVRPASALIDITPVNWGVAVQDDATGTGYILYTEESVYTRFSSNPPRTNNSDHFIAVRHNGSGWQYNNNSEWFPFVPSVTDVLIASVDFGADVITSLQGASGDVNGIANGYATGDLAFTANWWNGRSNAGEFTVSGTQFSTVANTEFNVTPTNRGVAVQENASGTGYLLYSRESVHTRLSANPPHRDNSNHFIATRYIGTAWQYNDNKSWNSLTPRPTDILVASLDYDADVATSLEGVLGNVNGIQSGYASGDLVFLANWWNGGPNTGEFSVNGTFLSTAIHEGIDVAPINLGIAVSDNAVGAGYILYSEESVHTRFSSNAPHRHNSDHFIGVRYNGTGWQYDNNTGWFALSPRPTDVLIASVDYSADIITSLQGGAGDVNGIERGYASGDLEFLVNWWSGGPNSGEFTINGSHFVANDSDAETQMWEDGFEGDIVGQPPGNGWSSVGSLVTGAEAYTGNLAIQATPISSMPADSFGNIKVASRTILPSEVEFDFDNPGPDIWFDVRLRTPRTKRAVIFELSKGGQMIGAVGVGKAEGGTIFNQAFSLRTSRGKRVGRSRIYNREFEPYSGENLGVPTNAWQRLSCRLDLAAQTFQVYLEGECVFADMEMLEGFENIGDVELAVWSAQPVTAPPEDTEFVFDDVYVGTVQPPGITLPILRPELDPSALFRFVVVGDTQIDPSAAATQGTIHSELGIVVPEINDLNPEFVIFVGDLISSEELEPSEMAARADEIYPVWLAEMENLDAPYFTIVGNHDAHVKYQEYIRPELDYVFETNGITFIAFSSTHPTDVDGWEHNGNLTVAQLDWIEQQMQLAQAKGNLIITVTHVTSHENEPALRGWYIRDGGPELRALYDTYGVFAELSGHMHRFMINWKANDTYYLSVPCVARYGGMVRGSGITIYDVFPDKVLQYEKPTKMPFITDFGPWGFHELLHSGIPFSGTLPMTPLNLRLSSP